MQSFTAFAIAVCAAPVAAQAPFAVFANVDNSGNQVGGNVLQIVDMSSNGRFVGFVSDAPLVPADTNFHYDAYVRDLDANVTLYCGPAAGGGTNNFAADVNVSGTGKWAVFSTYASNLGPTDTNGNIDAYRKDMQSGACTLVSIGAGGAQSNGHSSYPAVSDSGRWVAYRTTATNIVAVPAGVSQILYADLQTGTTVLASSSAAGVAGDNVSDRPQISADGRYVCFESVASNLAGTDLNGSYDVFRKDLATGAIARVSVDAAGQQQGGFHHSPSMSSDGRYIAFHSNANWVAADSNGVYDVYLKDMTTGAITLMSVTTAGVAAGPAYWPSVSADGKHVSFWSTSTQIVPGKVNGMEEVFIRDWALGTSARVCQSPTGADPGNNSRDSALSGNGRRIAFYSNAGNIVLPDNGGSDIIARDRGAPTTPSVYCVAKVNSIGCTPAFAFSGTPSASMGSGFTLTASNLLNQKNGTLFYSLGGANNTPFNGGYLCVQSPLRRMQAWSTGGSSTGSDCSGLLARDFNQWIISGVDPLLTAGVEVWAQFYSRDPGFAPPNNVNLTEAIDFLIAP